MYFKHIRKLGQTHFLNNFKAQVPLFLRGKHFVGLDIAFAAVYFPWQT